MKRWHGVLVMGWVVGCVAPSKEIGATVADTDSSSGGTETESTDTSSVSGMSASTTTVDPETMTSVGEVTTVGPDDTTTVGEDTTTSEDTTTGGLESCEEAENQSQCNSFPDGKESFFSCGWVPTVVYVGGERCQVVEDSGFEGTCILTDQADSCGTIEDSSCPDGGTLVFFRELGLEIGAIELLALESGVCSEATAGFEPCVMMTDGEFITYDPPECECMCPA